MNEIKKILHKEKVKNTPKKVWIFRAIFIFIITFTITMLLVAMYLNGYTLISFIVEFWEWFVIALSALIVIIISIIFFKMRKK